MKKLIYIILLSVVLYSCNNDNDNGTPKSGTLEVVTNPELAESNDALQAVFTSDDGLIKEYFYGTFDPDGKPETITSLLINKTDDNTSLNILLDDEQRMKSVFVTDASQKEDALITFDYSVEGKTIVRVFDYYFTEDNSKLLYEYTVDNRTKDVEQQAQYAGFGMGLVSALSNMMTDDTVPDGWMSQVIVTQGAIKALDLIVIGVGIFGCTISGPACIIGAIAVAAVGTNAANASTITETPTVPENVPPSPTAQVEDTQLTTTTYYIGIYNSYEFNYGGGEFCNLIGEYFNISFDVRIDESGSVLSSQVLAYQRETKVDPTCSPEAPGIPVNQHKYVLSSSAISGNSVTLNYTTVSGSPYCIASFQGTINQGNVNGTLHIQRADGVPGTLGYNLSIPISARSIN